MTEYHLTNSPENFKPIPGFPAYDIGDRGTVRSYWRRMGKSGGGTEQTLATTPQKILRHAITQGYQRVCLFKDGKHFHIHVHRLMLLAFVGPCPPGHQACHNDGIRTHCVLGNVRWDTVKNNHLDRHEHGTAPMGEKGNLARLTDAQILEIRSLCSQGYPRKNIAKVFGVSTSNVDRIVTRRTWTHI